MFQKETVSAHFSDKPTNQDLAFSVGARNSERLELCLTWNNRHCRSSAPAIVVYVDRH